MAKDRKTKTLLTEDSQAFNGKFWASILYFSTIPWLIASWASWLLDNRLVTICLFAISLFPLKDFVFNLSKSKRIDIHQFKFRVVVIVIPTLIFTSAFITGDLTWDSNNYHLTVMNLIWQHFGYGDWPLVLGAQYGASLVTLQSALICGLLGDIRWVGFVNLLYFSGIFLLLSSFLRKYFKSPIINLTLVVTMLSCTTILQSLSLAYTDIPLAFFVVGLLCGLINGVLGDFSKHNYWLVTFATIGVISTKSSSAFLIILVAPIFTLYFWKLIKFGSTPKWKLILPIFTLTISLFSPIRAFKETGQPTYPFGSNLFSKPAPFDFQALNSALDGSRSLETQGMSIFHASFYNWFAAIPNFIFNSSLYFRGEPNNLEAFFVSDARPLAYGPIFHLLLAAFLTFGLLNWTLTSLQNKSITLIVVSLLLVMTFGHTAPFLRYTYGVGLFIFPTLVLIITGQSQFLIKISRVIFVTTILISIPLNLGVISEKIEREKSFTKESNLSRFYAISGDKSFKIPECPKVYLLTQLPMFNAYIWGEKMCGAIVPFSEANLIVSSQEKTYIEGINVENIECKDDGYQSQVTTIFGYPSNLFDPRQCQRKP